MRMPWNSGMGLAAAAPRRSLVVGVVVADPASLVPAWSGSAGSNGALPEGSAPVVFQCSTR